MKNPKVTILMPVYNGSKYLRQAIESILNQTFKDFEFLIINDGSTDDSLEIIQSYKDSRILLIENEKNIQLPNTLNKGINLARGEYIVRMDADDISLPARLEKQVKFMDEHPNIGVCGTWLKTIKGLKRHIWRFPVNSDEIKAGLFFYCPFSHPTAIIRKSILKDNNLYYSTEHLHAEDYEFWSRVTKYTEFANIPEILFYYRNHDCQISRLHYVIQNKSCKKARLKMFRDLGIEPTEKEIFLHESLVHKKFDNDKDFIMQIENWLQQLKSRNDLTKLYKEPGFSKEIGKRWFLACRKASGIGFWIWNIYWNSTLSSSIQINKLKLFFFWLTCLIKFNQKDLR